MDGAAPRTRGRPRSEIARAAILETTLELVRARGYGAVTIEAIAAEAGVGKQTIYRWWRAKADLVLEAFGADGGERVALPDSGTFRGDLLALVLGTFRSANLHAIPILRGLAAEAQLDPRFARRFRASFVDRSGAAMGSLVERAVRRGELPRVVDAGLIADVIFGPMWYRLLVRHAPIDAGLARKLVEVALGGVRTAMASRARRKVRPRAGRGRR